VGDVVVVGLDIFFGVVEWGVDLPFEVGDYGFMVWDFDISAWFEEFNVLEYCVIEPEVSVSQ